MPLNHEANISIPSPCAFQPRGKEANCCQTSGTLIELQTASPKRSTSLSGVSMLTVTKAPSGLCSDKASSILEAGPPAIVNKKVSKLMREIEMHV